MENEFPPNSHTKKEARPQRSLERAAEKTPEKKEVQRVTKGKVIQRKKPLHKKFFEAFRPEDGRGFIEVALLDVLVPGIKDAVANTATDAIENALGVGGRSSNRRRSGGGGGGYTSYSGMGGGRSRGRRDRDDDRRPGRRDTRVSDDAREIVLDSRVEANEVLDNLYELLSKYDAATMRDLLSMVGEPHNPTHEDWGWTDLRGARVHRVREGYLLDLPRPEALD